MDGMEDDEIVFVDLQKVFDCIKHNILIEKLRCCGMDDLAVTLLCGRFCRDVGGGERGVKSALRKV